MSEAPDIRRWATQVARQAGEEPDAQEALRLMRIAEYWVKLADLEDRQRESTVCETTNNTSAPPRRAPWWWPSWAAAAAAPAARSRRSQSLSASRLPSTPAAIQQDACRRHARGWWHV